MGRKFHMQDGKVVDEDEMFASILQPQAVKPVKPVKTVKPVKQKKLAAAVVAFTCGTLSKFEFLQACEAQGLCDAAGECEMTISVHLDFIDGSRLQVDSDGGFEWMG